MKVERVKKEENCWRRWNRKTKNEKGKRKDDVGCVGEEREREKEQKNKNENMGKKRWWWREKETRSGQENHVVVIHVRDEQYHIRQP